MNHKELYRMLCQECPKKPTCTKLCKEARKYVNRDYVSQKEKTIGLPKYGQLPDLKSNTYLTKKEKEILTLLGKGLKREDVCKLLDISRHTLRMHLSNIKKKYLET